MPSPIDPVLIEKALETLDAIFGDLGVILTVVHDGKGYCCANIPEEEMVSVFTGVITLRESNPQPTFKH